MYVGVAGGLLEFAHGPLDLRLIHPTCMDKLRLDCRIGSTA